MSFIPKFIALHLAVDVYIRHAWILQTQFGRLQTGVDPSGYLLHFWIIPILFPDKLNAGGHSLHFLPSQATSSYGGLSQAGC